MKQSRFFRYSLLVIGLNLIVILWGAYVRATGSGAGCGSHWPLCNGVVIPIAPEIETFIEYTHRLTSGIAFLFVLGMFVWSRRIYPKHHPAITGTSMSFFFIITEALVGALLVRFEWVADNVSLGRVISISVHLVNTFLLLASLSLTAWWASGGKPFRFRNQPAWLTAFIFGYILLLILGISGAITALGDTLFPSTSLTAGIQEDFSPSANFLIRLRVWHPVIAIISGFYILLLSLSLVFVHPQTPTRRLAIILGTLFFIQLGAGLINLFLLAPVWMQIVHLFLADLVWITYVITTASVFQAN
jgi:heme A synthase